MDQTEPDPDVDDLLIEHLPGLRAYVRLRSGPQIRARDTSSDLVQSVCAEVLAERSRFEFRGGAAFRRWLYQATEHKLVERARFWRAEKRDAGREVAAGDGADSSDVILDGYANLFTPSRDACAREEVDRLERAFDALPQSYRDVITMSRFLGYSHTEIAQQSGRNEGAVRTQLSRALARLSELLN